MLAPAPPPRALESRRQLERRDSAAWRPAADIPDIYGPGAVLTAGNVYLKVTNAGLIGNAFTNLSTDPSGQWPGASGTEYRNFIALAVGAVNPQATDPSSVRRVSQSTEWRPPTGDPVDRIYRSFEGAADGARLVNDDVDRNVDGTPRIDEEFLNGRDDDGDGRIDEDFAAVGQQELACEMRDDTPAALADVSNEKHVPLGLECRQSAWAYPARLSGLRCDPIRPLQSVGPCRQPLRGLLRGHGRRATTLANYYVDDHDAPTFPAGSLLRSRSHRSAGDP